MLSFLITFATSQSSSYSIVLLRLAEPRSRPYPIWNCGSARNQTRDLMVSSQEHRPLDQWGSQWSKYSYSISPILYLVDIVIKWYLRSTCKYIGTNFLNVKSCYFSVAETDTMFNGVSAFPRSSTIVTGLKYKKKYRGYSAKGVDGSWPF